MGGKKDKSKGGKKEIKRKKGKERESYDYTSKEYQNFVDRLRNEGLGVFRVDADGNCLFRSLSHQLWEEESLHHRCRQEIMNYIESEKDHFSMFVEDDESFEDYVERLRTNAEWGGNQEIFAAARLYNVDISIYAEDMPQMVTQCDYDKIDRSKVRQLYLSFHGECHYNSLVGGCAGGNRDRDTKELTSKCNEMSINEKDTYNGLKISRMSKKEKRDAKKGGKLKKSNNDTATADDRNISSSRPQRELIMI